MTLKQRKLARNIAAGLNGKEAAIKAGYSPKSAKSTASDLLRHNLPVQAYLWRLLSKLGLTDDKLLRELAADLATCNTGIASAKKVISARVIVKADDPTVKVLPADARTDDFIEVEDHQARIGYLREKHDRIQTALKLGGHLQPNPDPGPKSITLIYGHNVAAQTVVKVTPDANGV